MHEKYKGITYPRFLTWFPGLKLWRRFMCKREMHLWDECLSGGSPWEHYLVCDACQLILSILTIDDALGLKAEPLVEEEEEEDEQG